MIQNYIIILKKKIQHHLDTDTLMNSLDSLLSELENYTSLIQQNTQVDHVNDDNVPRYIFFHDTVIKAYGKCPVVFEDENTRLSWLFSQKDTGELFFSIKDSLVEKTSFYVLKSAMIDMEEKLKNFHKTILPKDQLACFELCTQLFKDYHEHVCKSKRLKTRFNIGVNNLTSIIKQTGIRLDLYISVLLGKRIPVNILEAIDYNTEYYTLVKEFETLNNNVKKLESQLKKEIAYLKQLEISCFKKNNLLN